MGDGTEFSHHRCSEGNKRPCRWVGLPWQRAEHGWRLAWKQAIWGKRKELPRRWKLEGGWVSEVLASLSMMKMKMKEVGRRQNSLQGKEISPDWQGLPPQRWPLSQRISPSGSPAAVFSLARERSDRYSSLCSLGTVGRPSPLSLSLLLLRDWWERAGSCLVYWRASSAAGSSCDTRPSSISEAGTFRTRIRRRP